MPQMNLSTKQKQSWVAKSEGRRVMDWEFGVAAAAKSLQSCLTLCNTMDCSTPGPPVFHQLTELTQNSCPFSW